MPITIPVPSVFDLARRANGSLSSAQADTGAAVVAHARHCEASGGGCGPGKSVLTDDGYQGTYAYCPAATELDRKGLEYLAEDSNRERRTYAEGTWPQGLLSEADQGLLARQVLDWIASHPGIHDQQGMGALGARPGSRLAHLSKDADPATAGVTLTAAAIVCHLAGYALHTVPGHAHAIGRYRMTSPLRETAQRLLALSEAETRRLCDPDDEQALNLLRELAAHNPN
ncbi:hypothetical protein ABZ023_30940 [Streptomyces sp. NPDC006367]|uniref:hypothetical protein n=1 Tax=unclassified Streptomyces TaxID=2593676 RepID=UPI0033A14512